MATRRDGTTSVCCSRTATTCSSVQGEWSAVYRPLSRDYRVGRIECRARERKSAEDFLMKCAITGRHSSGASSRGRSGGHVPATDG